MDVSTNNRVFITGFSLVTEPFGNLETVKRVKTILRSEELILGAVSDVLKKAQGLEREATGVVFGSDNAIDDCKEGYYRAVLADGPLGASPLVFPYTSANAITAQVTIAFGLHYETFTITDGPLSFLKAAGLAFDLIRSGVCRDVIAGGFSQDAAFAMLMQTAPEPGKALSEMTDHHEGPAPAGSGLATVPSMEETFVDMAALLTDGTGTRTIKGVDKVGGNMISLIVEPCPSNGR